MMDDQLQEPEGSSKLFPKSPGQIILPFDEKHFKAFMSGLLGNPQSVSRSITGTFEIEIADLENLYHLILQRVAQQNNGALLRFLVRIVFSDDSSVELNSLEDLVSYNEVRPISPRGVHLTWDFLVRFQDKEIPEKQRIQVSFLTGDYERRKLGRLFLDRDDEDIAALYYTRTSSEGFANFRIEHTARTWGADIEALLTNHIKSIFKEGSRISKFFKKYDLLVGVIAASLFLILSCGGGYYSIRQVQLVRGAEFNALIKSAETDIDLVNTRLKFLGDVLLVNNGLWNPAIISALVMLCFIVAIILFFWVGITASRKEPSFILLTKQSFKNREISLKKQRKGTVSFVIAIITSIVSGIVANYLFAWLVMK